MEEKTTPTREEELARREALLAQREAQLEKEQADRGYQYAIGSDIYGAGYQNGGVAVLTAETKPAASFDGKPCRGNARIEVTFQIKDQTYVANEGAALNPVSYTHLTLPTT